MIDTQKLQRLEDNYDAAVKKLHRQREALERDYQTYRVTTENLETQLYHILEGKITEEALPYYHQMKVNSDHYQIDFHHAMAELEDKQSQLRRNHDAKVEELYDEANRQENDSSNN